METVIKGVGAVGGGAVKQIPEVQEALPLLEPESNGSLTDVGIVVAGVIVLAALYKFWLRYGKK